MHGHAVTYLASDTKGQGVIKGWSPLRLRRKRCISTEDVNSNHSKDAIATKREKRPSKKDLRPLQPDVDPSQGKASRLPESQPQIEKKDREQARPAQRHSWSERMERRRNEKKAKKAARKLAQFTSSSSDASECDDEGSNSNANVNGNNCTGSSSTSASAHRTGAVDTSGHTERQRGRRSFGKMPVLFGSLSNFSLMMRSSPRPSSAVSPTASLGSSSSSSGFGSPSPLPSPFTSPSSVMSPPHLRCPTSLLHALSTASFVSPPSSTSTSPSSSRRSSSVSSYSLSSSPSLSSVSLFTTDEERNEVIGGGDARLYCLLRELQLVKYWPHFLREEILLEDIATMNEEELTGDFHLTKYHSRRLIKVYQQNEIALQELMSLPPSTFFAAGGDDTRSFSSRLPGVNQSSSKEARSKANRVKRRSSSDAKCRHSLTISDERREACTKKVGSWMTPNTQQHGHNEAVQVGATAAEPKGHQRSVAGNATKKSVRITRKRSQSAMDRLVQQPSHRSATIIVADEEEEEDSKQTKKMEMKTMKKKNRRSKGKESGDQNLVVDAETAKRKKKKKKKKKSPKGKRESGSGDEDKKKEGRGEIENEGVPLSLLGDGQTVVGFVDLQPQEGEAEAEGQNEKDERSRRRKVLEEDRLNALVGKHRELAIDELEWDEETGIISSGMFGRVYRGKWRGVDCAIKELKFMSEVPPDASEQKAMVIKEFRREAALMQALGHHPNCICFFGAVTVGSKLCLVTEWAKNGSVYDLLFKKKTELPLEAIVKLARDAACGILHLHSENVIHRDIAARNVLVGENYTGKISDLGLSRMVSGVTVSLRNYTNSSIGAVKWMSPESIHSGTYSEKTDAYSFGVFLWEMWTRQQPWDDLPPLQAALLIAGGSKLVIPEGCPRGLADIIARCLATDPEERPNFTAIFQSLEALLAQLRGASGGGVGPLPHDDRRGSNAAVAVEKRSLCQEETKESRWRSRSEECRLYRQGGGGDVETDEESSEEDSGRSDEEESELVRLAQYNVGSGVLVCASG